MDNIVYESVDNQFRIINNSISETPNIEIWKWNEECTWYAPIDIKSEDRVFNILIEALQNLIQHNNEINADLDHLYEVLRLIRKAMG